MSISNHKDLKVWQESMDLVVQIYVALKQFPEDERFVLCAQMKRCSISVPSNIAEGFARKGNKELVHFLYISLGSLSELETQIEIANRLKYLSNPLELFEKIKFIRVMLSKLIKSIQTNITS